jgi:hypothetical protein
MNVMLSLYENLLGSSSISESIVSSFLKASFDCLLTKKLPPYPTFVELDIVPDPWRKGLYKAEFQEIFSQDGPEAAGASQPWKYEAPQAESARGTRPGNTAFP